MDSLIVLWVCRFVWDSENQKQCQCFVFRTRRCRKGMQIYIYICIYILRNIICRHLCTVEGVQVLFSLIK